MSRPPTTARAAFAVALVLALEACAPMPPGLPDEEAALQELRRGVALSERGETSEAERAFGQVAKRYSDREAVVAALTELGMLQLLNGSSRATFLETAARLAGALPADRPLSEEQQFIFSVQSAMLHQAPPPGLPRRGRIWQWVDALLGDADGS